MERETLFGHSANPFLGLSFFFSFFLYFYYYYYYYLLEASGYTYTYLVHHSQNKNLRNVLLAINFLVSFLTLRCVVVAACLLLHSSRWEVWSATGHLNLPNYPSPMSARPPSSLSSSKPNWKQTKEYETCLFRCVGLFIY